MRGKRGVTRVAAANLVNRELFTRAFRNVCLRGSYWLHAGRLATQSVNAKNKFKRG